MQLIIFSLVLVGIPMEEAIGMLLSTYTKAKRKEIWEINQEITGTSASAHSEPAAKTSNENANNVSPAPPTPESDTRNTNREYKWQTATEPPPPDLPSGFCCVMCERPLIVGEPRFRVTGNWPVCAKCEEKGGEG